MSDKPKTDKPDGKRWGWRLWAWIAIIPILFATYMAAYYATRTTTITTVSFGDGTTGDIALLDYRVFGHPLPNRHAHQFFRPAELLEQWFTSHF